MASWPNGRISRHGKACLDGLEELCRLSRTSSLSSDDCTAQLGRFRIWALNIGVLQDPHLPTSLEYRLREAPKLVDRIVELLEDIEESIEDVSQIASGERPNRVGSNSEDGVLDMSGSSTDEDVNEVTELDEIFQSLADSISSLFKISLLIRSATPRDRYAKATTSVKKAFDDSFDISHVGHKYPKLEVKENQWLRNRLGQAITQRRQYLKYCRDHHDKLGVEFHEDSTEDHLQLREPTNNQTRKNGLSERQGERAATIMSKDKPASTLALTTASTLMPSALESAEQAVDDNRSEFSEATSMADDSSGNQLGVIDIEKASQGMYPFECPYCFTLVRLRRQRPWTRHVFHDLKPYVCTFEDCDVKMFSDRHSWFSHEHEIHRNEYHCLFCPSLTFSSASSFKEHLVRKHADKVTNAQLPAIFNVSQRPVTRISAKDCPFCDEWDQSLRVANPLIGEEVLTVSTTQFRHHLANHLEQLALFSLPRSVDADNSEEVESKGTNAARAEIAGSTRLKSSSIASIVPHESGDPDLHTAAHQGLYEEVPRLLGDGVDINSLGQSWGTALHAASVAGNASIVELLMNHGADVYICIKPLGTVLQAACRGRSINVVTLLLAAGADPNTNSGNVTGNILETTALHIASSLGLEDIAKMLIRAGANVNAEAAQFNSIRPLHLAASKGNSKVAKILLDHGANVDCPAGKESLHSPLEFAAAEGWEEVVTVLISAGASFATGGPGAQALHKAAYGGHEGVMRILISSGADINLGRTPDGSTPLHTAAAAKMIGALDFLLRHGADVQVKDNERNTALHVAARNGFLSGTQTLRAAKADILAQNLNGDTPLDVAIRAGHTSIVQYLLDDSLPSNLNLLFNSSLLEKTIKSEHRAIVKLVLDSLSSSNIDMSGWRKSQAIFVAASTGKQDVLDLLISKGFNIDEKNELDETPLQTASSSGEIHAVRLLLASGANIDLATARGTALCYAASAGDAEIVSYLITKGATVDLNAMRSATHKPNILSLLQWRDPARSRGGETVQPPPTTPLSSITAGKMANDQDRPFSSRPTILLSPPDKLDQLSTLMSPSETASWQTEALEKQLETLINRATRDSPTGENWKESVPVVDIITENNETVMAPQAIRLMSQRLVDLSRVRLKTISLARVLSNHCGPIMRQNLVSENFCYALAQSSYGENSSDEVRIGVFGLFTYWLDRPDLFSDEEIDLKHLQSALDIILSNDSKDVPRKEGSLIAPRSVSLFSTPTVTELLSIEKDDQGIPGKALGSSISLETAGGPKEEDPFSNWSGSGRHPVDLDQFTNPNCIPVRENTIYHGGRYRFHSVRWKSYILTRKTVVLDSIWTRKEAFREVECLGLLMHSHIVQVVGSYSLGNRFSILLYPGTEWTLHQFLRQHPPQIENFGARKRVIAKIFICLISALGYIHETRLRHGNIRPRSVLVARSTSHQESYKVYLTGFDLALQPRVPASVSSDTDEGDNDIEDEKEDTRSSSEKGKYAAPEDFKGRSADIFSLGCVYLEMMAVVSTISKAQERLQAILNSKTREAGKSSLVYREHIDEIRTWISTFSTDVWNHSSFSSGDSAGLEVTGLKESTLTGLTHSMIDEDPAARPDASVILHGLGGEYHCCRRGRDEFEPDWFGANRALRDELLQEVEGSVNKFKEAS